MNIDCNPPAIDGRRLFGVRSYIDHKYYLLLTEIGGIDREIAIFRGKILHIDTMTEYSFSDMILNIQDGTMYVPTNGNITSEVIKIPEEEEFEALIRMARLECIS